ncbi:MAG TPA: hypothetical protein VHT30_10525 [Acidimicrobiales bacterium]|jgi:hypothetical protein|nr:hypothetical protein [Acidimicrobiales bacterium]
MLWRRGFAIAGALAVIMLVIAPPASAQTVSIQVAYAPMTATTGFSPSVTTATATCPAGTTLTSGGARLSHDQTSGAPTGAQVTNDGSVIEGTYPSDPSGNAVATNSVTPASWSAAGGYAGMAPGTDSITSFALCLTGSTAATVVEATAAPSPTTTIVPATATCPAGTSLIGGGGLTGFNGSNNTKIFDSYPSDTAGDLPTSGTTDPTSWTAIPNSNNPSGSTTTAFAICATDMPVATVVVSNGVSEAPVTGSTPLPDAIVTCPGGSVLLAGGSDITSNPSGPGTGGQGVHPVGDYPSDSAGNPQTASAASWTVVAMDGGQGLTSAAATAFALCATAPGADVPEFAYPALMLIVGGLLGGYVLYRWHRSSLVSL